MWIKMSVQVQMHAEHVVTRIQHDVNIVCSVWPQKSTNNLKPGGYAWNKLVLVLGYVA